MKNISLFVAILCLSLSVMAQVPSTINFQGNLTEFGNNTPIEGELAIIFELFDSNIDGSSIWSETQNPVMIINGIFNVKLGAVNPLPANAFSQALWLQITVDTETLDQRIELSSAPYSQNTATYSTPYTKIPDVGFSYIAGDTSTQNYPFAPGSIDLAIDDNDTGFDVPTDGNLSFYTNGQQRMSLRLDGRLNLGGDPISSGSGTIFEINTDPQGTTWGGMWMTNSAETGLPYYGYQNGLGFAFTYMDGTDWKVSNGGDRLVVTSDGNVGIGTNPSERLSVGGSVAAEAFRYATPNSDTISIPAAAFNIGNVTTGTIYITGPGSSNALYRKVESDNDTQVNTSVLLTAPVFLPNGARITGFDVLVWDNLTGTDIAATFSKTGVSTISVGIVGTTGTSVTQSGGQLLSNYTLDEFVDNQNFGYYIQVPLVSDRTQFVYGARVIYEVDRTY